MAVEMSSYYHATPRKKVPDVGVKLGAACTSRPSYHTYTAEKFQHFGAWHAPRCE